MSSLPDPPLYLGLPLKGCHNIEASAGTGKTTTLALLYLSVVLSGVSPENILVVTFTRAAAQDVRERIRKLLEDVRLWCSGAPAELLPDLLEYLGSLEMDPLRIDRRLRDALELFDRSPVQTIHSFCQSLLRQMSFLLGTPFDLALVPEDQDLAYESSVRLWRSTVYGQDPFLAEFFASVWSEGPRGWSATFRAVPARDDLPEEAFRPVEESFGDYCLRRQAFREEARSASGHLPPGALSDRMADLLGEREIPAMGLREGDGRLEDEFPPGSDGLKEALGEVLQASQKLKDDLRSSFGRLAGAWKHRELLERERRGVATYDDLILRVVESLKQEAVAENLRSRFPVAFVDESQDTSRDQSEIFKKIYRETRPGSALFWIGDPKQSIYRFRGADVQAYLEFSRHAKSFPENRSVTLSFNYRSVPGIIHAVNRLFERNPSPFLMEGVSYSRAMPVPDRVSRLQDPGLPSGSCFLAYAGKGPKDNLDDFARTAADEVTRLLSEGVTLGERKLVPSDIAVLVLRHTHGERVARFLREKGVPYNSSSPVSIFHTREADEIATVLDALLSPWRMPAICLSLATRLFGWNALDIDRITRDPEQARPVLEDFLVASRLWRSHGIRAALSDLFYRRGVWPRLLSDGRSRQRIDRLVDRIEGAVEQFPTPAEQQRFFSRERLTPDRGKEEETIGGEPGTGVHILTVHKSKGLEFPVVFVPFGIPGKNGKETGGVEEDDEEEDSLDSEYLRLLYVALTRARERIYLFCPLSRVRQSALDHLLEMEDRIKKRREKNGPEKCFLAFQEALEEVFSEVEGFSFFDPEPGVAAERGRYREPDVSSDSGGEAFEVRTLLRPLPVPRRVTSFTAIVAREHDDDAWNGSDPLIGDETAQDLSGNLEERTDPAGRAFGVFVHGILEEAGRKIARYRKEKGVSPPRPDVRNWILSSLPAGGTEEEDRWNEAAVLLAQQGLFSPLPIFGLPLVDLLDERARFEDPFLLRLGQEETEGSGDPSPHLRGVIDVVVWTGKEVYLVDYKTNLLTGEGDPYSPASLERVLRENHYDLQARIYSGACRQHLSLTGDQATFGGFLFLFLRGMVNGEGSGTILWRPDGEMGG